MVRVLIFLAALVWLAAPASAQVADLSGDWNSDWGTITLTPSADGYSGTYETDNGKIALRYTVSGDFEGVWSEDESGRRCSTKGPLNNSYYWGKLRFNAPTRAQPFTISWTYCSETAPVREWNVWPREDIREVAAPPGPHPFEGNWVATWEDSEEPEANITIAPPYAWSCTHPGDNWCQSRAQPNAGFSLSAVRASGGDYIATGIKNMSMAGGTLAIKWGYGYFGRWGGASTVSLAGENTATGGWTYGDTQGAATWRRAIPSAQSVQAPRTRADGTTAWQRQPLGQPITLTTPYSGPSNSMRGNRPGLILDILGDNLWGLQRYFLPKQSGLEINRHSYICANGDVRGAGSRANWNLACQGRGGVGGIRLHLTVWPHAAPGLKTLTLNDQRIPFLLDVENWPAPYQPFEMPQASITRVVLLDDQLGQRLEDGDTIENYAYPYKADGTPTGGETSRMLAIIGKDLTPGGEAFFGSSEPHIRYERLAMPSHLESAVREAAIALSGKPIAEDEQLVIARAHLRPGIRPGVKTVTLSGEEDSWPLLFKDQFGQLSFLRPGETPNSPQERTFYVNESLRLGVKALNDNFPTDGLEVVLEAELPPALQQPGRAGSRRLGRFRLTRTDNIRRGENFAVSGPILLVAEGSQDRPAAEAGETVIELKPNENIAARLQDRFALLPLPPVARATILAGPRRGGLWQSALDKVAVCVGGDPKSSDFPSDTSTVFENWVLTEALYNMFSDRSGTRRTIITKGDHAALILIRDELLPLVALENQKLLRYWGEGQAGETKAQRYYSMARQTPGMANNAFWATRTEKNAYQERIEGGPPTGGAGAVSRDIKLAGLLDFTAFQKLRTNPYTGNVPNVRDTQDIINRIVAKHIRWQYDETQNAIGRGYGAGNCDVKELLVIAGQKAEPAIASLMPDLVMQFEGRWVPDNEARGYVTAVHLLGAEVRAMAAYAQIDDAYKSIAVAAAAVPVTFASTALAASGGAWASTAGTAAAALALGADVADMAYFGKKGLEDYLSGEKDYFSMMGLSPVLGKEVVEEAQAGRSNGLMAAVGLLAPGLGVVSGVSALDDIAKINKGRALVRDKNALKNLDNLTDAERNQVAAYYKNLRETEASSTAALSAKEQADLDEYNRILREKTQPDLDDDSFANLDIGGAGEEGARTVPPPAEEGGVFARTEPVAEGAVPMSKTDQVADARRKTPKTVAELTPSQIGAPNSPYKNQRGEVFDQADSYNGSLEGVSNRKGVLPSGAKVEGADGKEIEFGELLSDRGGFTNTYKDGKDPDNFVIKERFVPDGANNAKAKKSARNGPESMEALIHDSEVGRKLLSDAAEDSSVFRVAKRDGEPVWVRDHEAKGGRYLYREENLAETLPDGTVVTNAADRIAARPSQSLNEAEALTVQMAIRELNQKGIVWTDSKLSNLDIRPNPNSPTGYEVVYFDFDGFRPVKGRDSLARWRTARETQQRIDAVGNRQQYIEALVHMQRNQPFDYRAFGKEMPAPMSAFPNKTGATYTSLNQLPREAFLRRAEQSLGKRAYTGEPVAGPSIAPRSPTPPSAPLSKEASSLWDKPPGSRLAERGVSREDISSLMAKRARGESLTEAETLDLIDDARASGRVVFEE